MSNINDKATVSLFVNGEQAEDAMDRLRKKAEDLDKQLQTAMAAGDKKSANKLQRELDRVKKELNKTESAAKGTGIVLNNLANSSIHGLRNALKYLEKELRMTKPNTEAWRDYAAQIDEVKARLNELNEELEGGSTIWDKFKNWAEDTWPAIDLLSRGYDSAISFMREYVDAYASMDQEMANVRKFTGMTEAQVNELNEAFKQIDTRSSREQLNKLAQEAGRLGLSSQEDVLGFVRAADKINVALDDLGEGATLTLSKLTDIFGDKERFGVEQSLLKTGSVINELSQSSSAAAPYIANFAERMSGVGIQAKLTVPQIMALGAVLDSTGQKVEASSTAVSQVLVRMMQDPAKYAKVAGLEVENFSRLLREDANEALLTFLETLNNAGGLDVLAPMFADMGENGSRAISTLTTLAKNIDLVRQRQQEATVAFEEGISIDKEFEVQNTTVQASLEKAQKRFQELRIELGAKLSPLMAHIITSASAMARAISVVVDFCIEHKTALLILTTTIGSYYVAVGTATIAQKAWNAAVLLGKTTVTAFKYTIGLCQVGMIALTHGTKAAGTAFTFLNQTMKANPFGLVISLLATLAVVIYKVVSATDKYKKDMNEAMKAANGFSEASQKEQMELDKLVGRLEGAQKGTKAYEDAKQAIINQYGKYLQGLINERGEITNLEEAYKRLTYAIRQNAKVRGIENARQAVTDTYTQGMVEQVQALRDSLADFGADARTIERIVAAVEDQIATGRAIPREIQAQLAEIQSQFDISHLTDRENTPMAIFNRISLRMDDYSERMRSLDNMESAVNPAKNAPDAILASAIKGLERAIEGINTDGYPGDLVGVITDSGDVETQYLSKEEIEDLLQRYQWEQGNRTGNASPNDGSVDPITPLGSTPPSDPSKPDRFAEEKAWREREEAEARIAYARGEASYSEHTARMSTIAADYYDRLLAREDVVGDERLKIMADYEESVRKENTAFNKLSLDDEERYYQDLLDRLRFNHQERLNQEGRSAQDRQHEQEYYAEVLELAELQHLRNIRDLYEEGSDEWLEAQRRFQQKEITAQERHLKNMERQQQEYANIKKRVFGLNQDEKDAEFARQFAALTAVYNQELVAVGDNEAEKLRIKEAYMAAELALRKEYNQAGAEDTKSTYETAIGKSVEWLQGDGGKALSGAISTLTSGMSAIFSGLSSMMQAELEIQTAKIEKRYDREIELAQGTSYKVAKLEKRKEKELAKAKNEANKKMFAMQVIQAVAQTAQNALSAYGSAAAIPVVGYILAPIAAAMAVAAGAIQIAAIKKQQQASEAQGYSQGGFTKPGAVDEPAGIVHAGEWVASQKLLANPVARPMIEALDRAQRTNTIGSLKPEDVSRSIRANDSLARIAEDDNQGALMVAAFVQNSQAVGALVERLNEPFVTVNTVTGDHGIKQAQDEYSRLMDNVTPKSKRKK